MRKLVIFFFILLILIFVLFSLNIELKNYVMYKFIPEYARDSNFYKLSNGENTIYLLGTIHSDHLAVEDYSLWHVEAVIRNLKPDLILTESKPEELQKDNIGDGPIEMPFAILTGRLLHIETDGMDWWDRSYLLNKNNALREQQMLKNIFDKLSNHKKTLVLTGYSHIPGFLEGLGKEGYRIKSFSNEEKHELFQLPDKQLKFPKGMAYYISKRIKLDENWLNDETDERIKSQLKNAIDTRKFLLNKINNIGE